MQSMESISIDAKHGKYFLRCKAWRLESYGFQTSLISYILFHFLPFKFKKDCTFRWVRFRNSWWLSVHSFFLISEGRTSVLYNTVHSVKYVSAVWGKKTFNYSNVVKLMACSGFVSSLKNTSMLYTVHCTLYSSLNPEFFLFLWLQKFLTRKLFSISENGVNFFPFCNI